MSSTIRFHLWNNFVFFRNCSYWASDSKRREIPEHGHENNRQLFGGYDWRGKIKYGYVFKSPDCKVWLYIISTCVTTRPSTIRSYKYVLYGFSLSLLQFSAVIVSAYDLQTGRSNFVDYLSHFLFRIELLYVKSRRNNTKPLGWKKSRCNTSKENGCDKLKIILTW